MSNLSNISFGYIIILSLVAVLFSSCVVNHPVATTSQPDYNNRVEVSGAHYKRKMTATGYTMLGVATAGGAVAGWFTPMVSHYDGAEKKNLAPVSAAIGAVAGFGTAYFISRIMGWGKTREVKDPKKWMKKSNPQYIVFDEQTKNYFRVIHLSAEQNYTVKNMADVDDYRKAFPSTTHYNEVVKQSISMVKRDELLKVLEYYPQSSHSLDVKRQYVESSPTVAELFKAIDHFPETKVNVEPIAVSLVQDCGDALRFQARFPQSDNLKKVLVKAITDCSEIQAEKVIAAYGNRFELGMEDILDLDPSPTQIRNYTRILFRSKNYGSMDQAALFYVNYPWLRYSTIKEDIMKSLWDVNMRLNSSKTVKQQNDALRSSLSLISKKGRTTK